MKSPLEKIEELNQLEEELQKELNLNKKDLFVYTLPWKEQWLYKSEILFEIRPLKKRNNSVLIFELINRTMKFDVNMSKEEKEKFVKILKKEMSKRVKEINRELYNNDLAMLLRSIYVVLDIIKEDKSFYHEIRFTFKNDIANLYVNGDYTGVLKYSQPTYALETNHNLKVNVATVWELSEIIKTIAINKESGENNE